MANQEDALYVGLSKEWRNILHEWQNSLKTCTRCQSPYKEIDNIGKWQCHQHAVTALVIDNRRYQSGFSTGSIRNATWPCCGREEYSNEACVPADHTDKPRGLFYSDDDDIPLLTKIQHLVEPVVKESIVNKFTDQENTTSQSMNPIGNDLLSKDYVTIRRYNSAKNREINKRMIPDYY
jgi:hypothetical protein